MQHTIVVETELEAAAPTALMQRACLAALEEEGVGVPCEVDVLFTNDEGIREVNRDQRKIDAATDVLSFPMFEFVPATPVTDRALLDPETGLLPLGDMVISLERAEVQAEEFGHSLERELAYLAVHSVLHLLGYDHMDDGAQKAQMRAREEIILEKIGITRA